jgi:hypothetical protein
MFSRVRIAIRFFFVGLAVGILLAPRSGEETRRMVRAKADRILNDVLDAATLGTVDTGPAAAPTGNLEDEADAPKQPTRATDGGSRTRTRAASTGAPAS